MEIYSKSDIRIGTPVFKEREIGRKVKYISILKSSIDWQKNEEASAIKEGKCCEATAQ